MYEAINDPYCYPGTTVLKNKIGIKDQKKLDAFEAEMSSQRATEPLPAGTLDQQHYRAVHKHLFGDVYTWAGKLRTVRIAKGGSMFCYPESIDREMGKLFKQFATAKYFKNLSADAFAKNAAHFLAELNAIHPFREGNGRSQLTFLIMLAERAGHALDLNRMNPDAILNAVIASFGGKEKPLAELILGLIETR